MKWLSQLVNRIDRFTDSLGKIIAWLTLAMVLLTFLIVLLRYGFNLGWIAMQESVVYFHGMVFMLGAGFTLKHNSHVRVDIFYQKFSIKTKAIVDLVGCLLLLLPVTIFIFMISFDYVSTSWMIMEKSAEAGGLPFVYISKTLILLFSVTLLMQGIAEIGRNILILRGACSPVKRGSMQGMQGEQ